MRKNWKGPGTKFVVFVTVASLLAACGDDSSSSANNQSGASASDVGDRDTGDDQPDMGDGEDAGLPDVELPPRAAKVETRILANTWKAGQTFTVECALLDDAGLPVTPETEPTFSVAVAPSSSFEVQGLDVTGYRAGEGTIRCGAPNLGLVDDTPETVTITPSAPDTVITHLDRTTITAGETINATCDVMDAYGNAIDDAQPELMVSPSGAGISVNGLSATIEPTGIYDVVCDVSGASNTSGAVLDVEPGLPASIVLAKIPNQNVYAIGQIITFNTVVTDNYGNEIPDAVVDVTVQPGAEPFGVQKFRFDTEGVYDVTATVPGPNANGITPQAMTQVIVNSIGPSIDCLDPVDGTMETVTPGSQLTFSGRASDANDVSSVTVNGSGVTVASDGTFSSDITARYGINFVEVVAQDAYGEENSRTCAFLGSDNWQPHDGFIDDSVMLKLLQSAIDDGNANDLDSFNDLLDAVLNSQGIIDELDSALSAANPLQPMTCHEDTCVFGACWCWISSEITYKGLQINGPNDSSLSLVSGGLRAVATIRDLRVKTRARGVVSEIPYDTTGWVTFDHVRVDLTMDLGLQNGVPTASVRQVNSVDVGNISTDFSGLDGAIINIVVSLFQGTVKDLIKNTLRDYISNNFDAVLDDVVSSLDISTLGTTFDVPRLDSTGSIPLGFNVQFTSLGVSSTRALFGIGTKITGPTANARPTKGVAMPSGSTYLDPAASTPVTVAVHVGILNQALHALWRGGFFDATIDSATLGGSFPAGAKAKVRGDLPPVIENLGNGNVKLMLGAMNVVLTYPGIFDDPISVRLGATATTSVQIAGDDLSFSNINIDELYFSADFVSLDANTRSVIEGFLKSVVQQLVDSSLNQSLPALPIPAFEITPSLGTYGLPVGDELGIVNPTLDDTTTHFLLKGSFGLR